MTVSHAQSQTWLADDSAILGMVSVIIPNYNHAQYLPHAIDSVLQQTYEQVEIIVVDDGSTDHSREVAKQYAEHIRYIWQENQGLSAARNTGLRAANGEYIALLDADDMLEPDFMSTLVGILADNPTADGVICGYRFVDDNDVPLPQVEGRQLDPNDLYSVLLDGNFLVPESILVHRRCYAAAGAFDETLRACEDWDMWLRISRQFTILSTPRLLTRHRALPGSMSSDPDRMLNNRLIVLDRHFGAAPQHSQDGTATQRRAYARAYLTSAVEYLQVRDIAHAHRCLRDMVHIAPHTLMELDTFYELGLGDQLKGRRGHFVSLNLAWNERTVEQLLSQLLAEVTVARPYRRVAYAQFHYALGLLHYGACQPTQARRHLLKSFSYRPRQVGHQRWWSTLLKSLLPKRWVEELRSTLADQTEQPEIL